MSTREDAQRLAMSRRIQELTGSYHGAHMATLYLNSQAPDFRTVAAIHPLLVPSRDALDAIKTRGWHSVRCSPGPVSNWDEAVEEHLVYHRFGRPDGFEPLVHVHGFHDLKDQYVEVSEEFRLFHNLYHDQKHRSYVKLDDSGQETVVVELQRDRIRFRVQELRQYLSIREMHLLMQFDFRELSRYSLAELSLVEGAKVHHDEESIWELCYTEPHQEDHVAFARLIGKRLLVPFEKGHSGMPSFSEVPKRYGDFLIGYDDQGGEMTSTCDPAKLPTYGADPEFFTPVSFHKDVLERYHRHPSKFSVSDGLLSCGNLWMLSFDDDHDDRVCAWLGDLGENLPYREQLHWRVHNFQPPDSGVSTTFFNRQFAAQFAESCQPEHQFRELYRQLAETCERRLGWQFLKPLHQKDEHRLASVRVPASAEQPAVDEQVLSLAIILVDSLNKHSIEKLVPQTERPTDDGSIVHLEAMFRAKAVHNFQPHIDFLRTVQGLRSAGSAHRKGSSYERYATNAGMNELGLQGVVANLVERANDLLRFLIAVVESERLAP